MRLRPGPIARTRCTTILDPTRCAWATLLDLLLAVDAKNAGVASCHRALAQEHRATLKLVGVDCRLEEYEEPNDGDADHTRTAEAETAPRRDEGRR